MPSKKPTARRLTRKQPAPKSPAVRQYNLKLSPQAFRKIREAAHKASLKSKGSNIAAHFEFLKKQSKQTTLKETQMLNRKERTQFDSLLKQMEYQLNQILKLHLLVIKV